MNNSEPLETERRFLIRYPDTKKLMAQPECRAIEMVQTYLLCDTGSLRVRRSLCEGRVCYHRNEKRRVTDMTNREYESSISEEEYKRLLESSDPERRSVEKTRYTIPYGCHIAEIDIYPFWKDRAIMEVELSAEDEELDIPDFVDVIKEVTHDKRYSNRALAKEIITEEL